MSTSPPDLEGSDSVGLETREFLDFVTCLIRSSKGREVELKEADLRVGRKELPKDWKEWALSHRERLRRQG